MYPQLGIHRVGHLSGASDSPQGHFNAPKGSSLPGQNDWFPGVGGGQLLVALAPADL